MKKLALALLFFYASVAFSQTQTVVGTATDSDGQIWAYGTYRIEFYPNPSYPNISQYYVNGTTPLSSVTTTFNGALSPLAFFSQAGITNNNNITPVGSQWKFTICPMATSQCGVFQAPVTGNINLTTTINATIAAPRFGGVYGTYGYNDTEVSVIPTTPSSWYYNVLLQCLRTYNFQTTSWSCSTASALAIPVTTVDMTGNYTAAQSDVGIRVNCASPCTLALPVAPVSGFFVTVEQQGAGALTINPSGNTYDGATAINTTTMAYQPVVIIWTLTGYHMLSAPIAFDSTLTATIGPTGRTLKCTTASASSIGCVRVDGTTIVINPVTGIISASATTFTLTTIGNSGAASYIGGVLNIPVYGTPWSLTNTGTSGAATYVGNVLNIPIYAPTVPNQYKVWACEPGLGDGFNAMAAQTYSQITCYNITGVTITFTNIKCLTDNNGTSTMTVTNGANTAFLTGAVTCTNAWAAGTQSGTTTLANGDYLKFTFVSDGTSKQTTWLVAGTY